MSLRDAFFLSTHLRIHLPMHGGFVCSGRPVLAASAEAPKASCAVGSVSLTRACARRGATLDATRMRPEGPGLPIAVATLQ